MKHISIRTRQHTQFLDITAEVREAVAALGVKDGVVTVFVPHTTAGVTINENADPDVVADMTAALERMVPWEAGYAHDEGNAAAHVRPASWVPLRA